MFRVEVEALVDAVAGPAHPGQAVPQGLNLQVAFIRSVHVSPLFRAAARRRTCAPGARLRQCFVLAVQARIAPILANWPKLHKNTWEKGVEKHSNYTRPW